MTAEGEVIRLTDVVKMFPSVRALDGVALETITKQNASNDLPLGF